MAIRDKYLGFRMNSRKKCIRKEFAKQIDDSKCEISMKALFIFANLLWIHYLFGEFIMYFLFFFEFTIFSRLNHEFIFLSREITMSSLGLSRYTTKSKFFHEFTIYSLSFSWIDYNSTFFIWLNSIKVSKFVNSEHCLLPKKVKW